MLVVGMAHSRPAGELRDGGRVARYALGRDYHNRMTRKLRRLARRIGEAGVLGRSRPIVDAGPLLERSHAAEAGLGFASKAANLLHPSFGPWFFLGELLLPLELEPTPAPRMGSCGSCTACIDACPTGAMLEPGLVDAPRCISYQTIEHRWRPATRDGAWAWVRRPPEVCPCEAPTGGRTGTHPDPNRARDGFRGEPFEARSGSQPGARGRGLARNAGRPGNVPSEGARPSPRARRRSRARSRAGWRRSRAARSRRPLAIKRRWDARGPRRDAPSLLDEGFGALAMSRLARVLRLATPRRARVHPRRQVLEVPRRSAGPPRARPERNGTNSFPVAEPKGHDRFRDTLRRRRMRAVAKHGHRTGPECLPSLA